MKLPRGPTSRIVTALTIGVAACGPGDGTAQAAEGAETETARPEGASGAVGADPIRLQELPEGVTREMVARGEQLFRGAGFCYTCHGQDGRGVPQLGTDLGDQEWIYTDGTYEGIAERIRAGVTAEASTLGVPMPPRGGGRLSDEQVRALAAYVWVLSRRGT